MKCPPSMPPPAHQLRRSAGRGSPDRTRRPAFVLGANQSSLMSVLNSHQPPVHADVTAPQAADLRVDARAASGLTAKQKQNTGTHPLPRPPGAAYMLISLLLVVLFFPALPFIFSSSQVGGAAHAKVFIIAKVSLGKQVRSCWNADVSFLLLKCFPAPVGLTSARLASWIGSGR